MSILPEIRGWIRDAATKGFFHLYAANLLVNFIAFGAQLLVVKFLSPEEIGHLKTIQSFIGLAVIVAGCGINTAILKLCAEPRPESEKAGLLRYSLLASIVPVTATLVILVAASGYGWFSPIAAVNRWLPYYALVIPGTIATAIVTAYLQAHREIKLMAAIQSLSRLAVALALVALTAKFLVPGYIAAVIGVTTLAALPLLWLVRRQLLDSRRVEIPKERLTSLALYSLAANLTGALIGYLDILLLNYLAADRVSLGYYSIATIFILGLSQITSTIQTIATPYFSQYSSDAENFRRVFWRYQSRLIILSVVVAVTAIFLVPPLIVWLYGESYAPAGDYFRILALRYLIWSSYALIGVALLGLGLVRYSLYAVLVSLVATATASWILINDYQFTGAAWAQVIGATVTLVAVAFLMRKALRKRFTESR